MKKIILSLVILACAGTVATAQNYDDIRTMLILNQNKKAKESLDKAWSNAKFVSKPEAYALKATIYGYLVDDSSMQSQAMQIGDEAIAAYTTYKEKDPKQELINKEAAYSNTPALIFNILLNRGIKATQKEQWDSSLSWFTRSEELSSYLIKEKKIAWSFDTLSNFYGGISAQNANKLELAKTFYGRLADQKVAGPDYANMYRFLVYNSFKSGDMASFNKYKTLGKELYPKDEYFQYEEIDYILGLEDAKERNALIEKNLATNPDNYKLQSAYGELLFDQLNPKDGPVSVENYDETESKMVKAFEKAAELKPESALGLSNLGNHFINKSGKIGARLDSVRTVIRDKIKASGTAKPAAAKPGTKPAPATASKADPADAAARDQLTKEYEAASDKAREYYEKAVAVYSKLSAPTLIEKQQYRNAVGYLIDLATEKKNSSKATPALYDKWDKEEKKWADMYHKM